MENTPPNLRRRTGRSVVAVERKTELIVDLDQNFRFATDDAAYICGRDAAKRPYVRAFYQLEDHGGISEPTQDAPTQSSTA